MPYAAGPTPACVLEPTAPVPVDPYLFGVNTRLGPIENLPFEDPALLRAASTLGAGALRWPGGSVANYWSIADGRYDDHAKSGGLGKVYADIWGPRTAWAPRGTFGPRQFWDGVGSASAGAARTGPVWVLNVFSLSPAEQLRQVEFLRHTGVPVSRVELGNEAWQYDKNLDSGKRVRRWPNGSAYMASILPVCRRVRELFPGALISVSGHHADQRWNAGLAEYADHFDAVSLHVYSPVQCDLDLHGPGLNQYSALAGASAPRTPHAPRAPRAPRAARAPLHDHASHELCVRCRSLGRARPPAAEEAAAERAEQENNLADRV